MVRGTHRTGARTGSRPRRVERKFSLSAEAARRLDVHSAGTGLRPGQILEDLILTHLRRFVLTDRGGEPQICEGTPVSRGGNSGVAA